MNGEVSAKVLEYSKVLVEGGKIKVYIVQIFDLEEAAQAQDLVSAEGARGKVLLKIWEMTIENLKIKRNVSGNFAGGPVNIYK